MIGGFEGEIKGFNTEISNMSGKEGAPHSKGNLKRWTPRQLLCTTGCKYYLALNPPLAAGTFLFLLSS